MSLERTLTELLMLFRYIFDNDRNMLAKIDKHYEAILIQELKHIPNEVASYIQTYIDIIKSAYMCFDVIKFNNILTSFAINAFPEFNLDSHALFVQGVNKLDMSNDNKARIKNLTTKFKPIFLCLDKLINNFKHTIKKLAARNDVNAFDSLM